MPLPQRLADRGFTLDLEAFRELDAERRGGADESEQLKAQRNAESQEIGKLKKAGEDTAEQQQKVREMGERIAELDEKPTALDEKFRAAAGGHSEYAARIRAGREERGRQRRSPALGHAAGSSLSRPKPHWDLGPELGILDLERAAKITGARFAVYWGWARSWNGR